MFRNYFLCAAAALVACHASAQSLGNCSQRVVAGSPTTDAGDGGPATEAQLFWPSDVARDTRGNLYIADRGNNKVRVVGADGKIHTFAGTGVQGSTGDGGPATSARLNQPKRLATGPAGVVYILENNRVRRVRTDGVIETAAGTGLGGFEGDGHAATAARLRGPTAIAVDAQGNLYIADAENGRVRRVNSSGTITTVAGSGKRRATSTGDGKPAATAFLQRLKDVAVGADGTIYLATISQIHSVGADGILHTIAGAPASAPTPTDGSTALDVFLSIRDLGLDLHGRVAFVTQLSSADRTLTIEADGKLKRVVDTRSGSGLLIETDGTVTRTSSSHTVAGYAPAPVLPNGGANPSITIAGRSPGMDPSGEVAGTAGGFWSLGGITTDISGNVYVADSNAGKIRKLSTDGRLSTVAGVGGWDAVSPDGTPALQAAVAYPIAVAVNHSGEIYYAEPYTNRVRKVRSDGTISTVAGSGQYPFEYWSDRRDGKKATDAAVHAESLALDADGDLYISDPLSRMIWRVSPDGILHEGHPVNLDSNTYPTYLASGPDGVVWFVAAGSLKLSAWRFDSQGKAQNVQDLSFFPAANSRPFAIDARGSLYLTAGGLGPVYKIGADGTVGVMTSFDDYYTGITLDRSGTLFAAADGRLRLIEVPEATTCAASLAPLIPDGGIVSAASYGSNHSYLAPGTLVSIFGRLVGPATPAGGVAEGGRFQTIAGGTEVWINGAPAPVIYASEGQTTAIIPFSAAENDFASVQVSVNGLMSNQSGVWLQDAAPGIFTQDSSGKGSGSILNQDYSINTAANPADRGSVVMVYLTGLGALEPALDDGVLAPAQVSHHTAAVAAQIDSRSADVSYAGTSPGLVAGVSQVNVRIPLDATSGARSGARSLTVAVPSIYTYGDSQPVTIHIR